MAQAPPLTVIFHGSPGAYRKDGPARSDPLPVAANDLGECATPARCQLGRPTLGEHGAQLLFDRGQVPEAEGEGPVLGEDLWRLVVGQQQDEPAGG
jgi:hypothetical protein